MNRWKNWTVTRVDEVECLLIKPWLIRFVGGPVLGIERDSTVDERILGKGCVTLEIGNLKPLKKQKIQKNKPRAL